MTMIDTATPPIPATATEAHRELLDAAERIAATYTATYGAVEELHNELHRLHTTLRRVRAERDALAEQLGRIDDTPTAPVIPLFRAAS